MKTHGASNDRQYLLLTIIVKHFCMFCIFRYLCVTVYSGVTMRGEVRQLPQGAKRQGALGGAFGRRIVCFALQPNF